MSLSVEWFDANDYWGYIENVSGVKTAYDQTGTTAQQRCSNGVSVQNRAYYSFKTDTLPDTALVDFASWHSRIKSVSENEACDVADYALRLYWEHARIGSGITTDDWGFANADNGISWGDAAPSPDTDFEIELSEPNDAVNKAGDTDVEIRGNSSFETCAEGPVIVISNKWSDTAYHSRLEVGYVLQGGALSKIPSGNITHLGPMCLAALSRFLMEKGILPWGSRIDRIEGSDIHVVTRFAPRMADTCIQ